MHIRKILRTTFLVLSIIILFLSENQYVYAAASHTSATIQTPNNNSIHRVDDYDCENRDDFLKLWNGTAESGAAQGVCFAGSGTMSINVYHVYKITFGNNWGNFLFNTSLGGSTISLPGNGLQYCQYSTANPSDAHLNLTDFFDITRISSTGPKTLCHDSDGCNLGTSSYLRIKVCIKDTVNTNSVTLFVDGYVSYNNSRHPVNDCIYILGFSEVVQGGGGTGDHCTTEARSGAQDFHYGSFRIGSLANSSCYVSVEVDVSYSDKTPKQVLFVSSPFVAC